MSTQFKFKRCSVCNCTPKDMGDFTMGELDENNRSWYCFDHIDNLWENCSKKYGCSINNTSDWWSLLEKFDGQSPRPR